MSARNRRGEDVVLADPAGDQLAVLAAEIQDGDHLVGHGVDSARQAQILQGRRLAE